MGRLVAVVGSTGVGKTTLVEALCINGPFVSGLEEHNERPFQQKFKAETRFALANQMDYLLLRAEQEETLRQSPHIGITDGGMDMDFHGFTRLFHVRGWLSDAEFDLCERLYRFLRSKLPLPDFVIHLSADPESIARRLAGRDRINIACAEDILLLDSFLEDWLVELPAECLLRLEVSKEDPGYTRLAPILVHQILDRLGQIS